MDKKQYRVLRKISRKSRFPITDCSSDQIDIIHFLSDCGFLQYESDDNEASLCCYINQKGKAALYEWRKERRRWYIPLIISIFAAIGGYREELMMLLRAISSLCKSIPIG